MNKVHLILIVLTKGKCLLNPEYWKNVQNIMNITFSLLFTLRLIFPEAAQAQISDESLRSISDILSIITIGLINMYFTTATTDKIGFKPK